MFVSSDFNSHLQEVLMDCLNMFVLTRLMMTALLNKLFLFTKEYSIIPFNLGILHLLMNS